MGGMVGELWARLREVFDAVADVLVRGGATPKVAAAMSASEARDLLHEAFPWGAAVEPAGGEPSLRLDYDCVDGSDGDDTVDVSFERGTGDYGEIRLNDAGEPEMRLSGIANVRREQLEEAIRTGRLLVGDVLMRLPEAEDASRLDDPFGTFVGGQADSDDRWTARMRLHQSWWRTFRLRVPFGVGPTISGSPRGNMLTDDDAANGLNFLSGDAFACFKERSADRRAGVHVKNTSRNLLASQAMAFNVFGHLSKHLDLASAMFSNLFDEPVVVTSVDIEHLIDALGDHTAFDVLATYNLADGTPRFVAIEIKLSEPFSQKDYDWAKYLVTDAFSAGAWNTADAAQLGDRRWSQLWRDHLLAVQHGLGKPELGEPAVLVVHHPRDDHCVRSVDGYRKLLSNPESCQAIDLARIVEALRPMVATQPTHQKWLQRFEERYLWLELSEPLQGLSAAR
jgi:hypothetical protein